MMQKYVTRKGIFYGTYYENYRGTRAGDPGFPRQSERGGGSDRRDGDNGQKDYGAGIGSVGASTGRFEAVELRDGDRSISDWARRRWWITSTQRSGKRFLE